MDHVALDIMGPLIETESKNWDIPVDTGLFHKVGGSFSPT